MTKPIRLGDKVTLTEQTKVVFCYPDGMEGTVIDVVDAPFPFAVNFPEMGEDFVEFFAKKDLIKLDE